MIDGLHALVRKANECSGLGLEFVGTAEHGDSGGAAYVRWPDGRDGVVTRWPGSRDQLRQTTEVLAYARSRGLPVPAQEAMVAIDDGSLVVVQERLPGRPPARVDAAVIDAMVAVNERFAGVLVDRPDVPIPPMWLRESGPVFPRHALLAGHSPRSRRLLGRIREIGAAEPHEMVGDDLVHPDYTFGNVLYDSDSQVSGVVDWNWGASRGDRRFALVRICVDLWWSTLGPDGGQYGVQQSAFDRIDEVLQERIEPALLRMYWAHTTLNQLHWAILENQEEVVDLFLRFGESRLE